MGCSRRWTQRITRQLTGRLRHAGLQSSPSTPWLSGGQRQRAFIAMVLAQDAPVVLFDEPTSFLDVSACYEVMELMRSLKEEHGKTVVAVIHDINLALKYSDEVCVMRAGKLLAQGAPHEAEVLAAVEDAFDVRIELLHGELGSSYALWRRTKR